MVNGRLLRQGGLHAIEIARGKPDAAAHHHALAVKRGFGVGNQARQRAGRAFDQRQRLRMTLLSLSEEGSGIQSG